MMWGYLQDALFGMGLFSYALGLAGSVWGLFKTVVGPQLWPLIRDRFITSYDIHYSGDFGGTKVYRWLGESIKTRRRIRYDGLWVPGEGWYTFKKDGVRFGLRIRAPKLKEGSDNYYATFYTAKSRDWFEGWLRKLAKERRKPNKKASNVSVRVLTPSGSLYLGRKAARSSESLIFEGDLHKTIGKELVSFLKDEQYYVDRGIPWTLGYLLHGPPGTGKSSIPFYLAGKLHRDILIIPAKLLKLPNFSQTFLSAWEQDTICLFDDVDGILGRRPGQEEMSSQEVLHELLGLLDSPLSPHGFIFFMTTNFPEILDAAMIRPGRIDRKYYVGAPQPPEVKRLFNFFYPEGDGDAFLKAYGDRACSPATLSAFFSRYRDVDKILTSMDKLDALSNKPKASFELPEKKSATADTMSGNLLKLLLEAHTSGKDLVEAVEAMAEEFEFDQEDSKRMLDLVTQPQFLKELSAEDRDLEIFELYLAAHFPSDTPKMRVGNSYKAKKCSSDEEKCSSDEMEKCHPAAVEDDWAEDFEEEDFDEEDRMLSEMKSTRTDDEGFEEDFDEKWADPDEEKGKIHYENPSDELGDM